MSIWFSKTNYEGHPRPALYRVFLWIFGWLEIFDATVFILSLTFVTSQMAMIFLFAVNEYFAKQEVYIARNKDATS